MTWLLIDPAAVARFEVAEHRRIGGWRTYYITHAEDERLALIVCRDDRRLEDLAGLVVDAAIGWDAGLEWFFHHKNCEHTKVTIYAILHEHRGLARRSLSHVLDDAPLRCAP